MTDFGGMERQVNDLNNRGVISENLKREMNGNIRSAREYSRHENWSEAQSKIQDNETILLGFDYAQQVAQYMRKPRFSSVRSR